MRILVTVPVRITPISRTIYTLYTVYAIYTTYSIGESMPQVAVYIRNADLDKWKALSNKAEFISNALNELGGSNKKPTGGVVKKSSVKIPEEKIESVKQMVPGILTAADLAPKIKERGACRKCGAILDVRGKCIQKGCK